jgi:hypothetical protein
VVRPSSWTGTLAVLPQGQRLLAVQPEYSGAPPTQAAGLSPEEVMRLLAELQEMDRRLRELREGLVALVELASPDTS